MKIAFLSFWSGIVYRGVETYVHELANRLTLLGNDVTVYQNGPDVYSGNYKTISIDINFKLSGSSGNVGVLLNQFVGANADRRFTGEVLKILDKNTDVIISTNNRFQAYMCKKWSIGKKVKLVIPGQGGPGFDERLALWSFPDAFVPLTQFQKKWAEKANPFINVSDVIHNGVDLDKYHYKKEKIDLGLSGKIVLCAAAYWPVMKRQHLLIKAISKLKDVSLVLAGDGEGKEELHKLCERYIPGRYLMKAYKYDKMPGVYASSDVFAFPTWTHESFGIAMVEAMASGLPVVATDDPIRREIVGEAGLFIDPTDTDLFADAIVKALGASWGEKPRDQAKKFSWDKIASKYEKLLEGII